MGNGSRKKAKKDRNSEENNFITDQINMVIKMHIKISYFQAHPKPQLNWAELAFIPSQAGFQLKKV